ncbi:glycosyltransferase family 2 protein [Dinghuibacter silviterrae]|uniref:Glycosyl transferase family 2 n=1 Tax=Dinghuibacter silviterrae TaxID=1539049 RepID=A0A4R8DG66_9BACT|nr:glycosyltransferase [Dinghuibacter silviterrae]TDW96613.1 glycosyl transferase family 2 [Dinghuibacter silviterrae]
MKLSVLMPAYNAERYIGQAISSVLGQTFADFELVVVDDGSTDGTAEVVQSFRDSRIVLIRQANQGIAGALNTGLGIARSGLIARFDADDICYPYRLQRQYSFMRESPDYVLAGSMVDYADMEGRFVFTYRPPGNTDRVIRRLSYKICPFIHSSVIYRRDAVRSLGGYNVHAHGFEDHLLWRRLIRVGKVYNMPEVLMRVRFNPNSLTMDETCRSPLYLHTKYEALRKESIHAAEGKLLLEVIKSQEQSGEREQAYHVLLAKKYLWNNAQPRKAREHARRVLSDRHYTRKGLYLLLLSYLPGRLLVFLYRTLNFSGYERS